eukprot:363322-Chlamydomonas_euryale.AAC.10
MLSHLTVCRHTTTPHPPRSRTPTRPAPHVHARSLLDAGADADAADDGGLCALAMAAARGRASLVAALLAATSPGAPGLEAASGDWTASGVLAAGEKLRAKLEAEQAAAASQQGGGASAAAAAAAAAAAVPEPEAPDDAAAAAAKRRGDEAFVRGDAAAAAAAYGESLRHATRSAPVWANRAAARLRLGLPEDALQDAVVARTLDPAYVKAWYREGSAYAALKRWEDAAVAFFEASNLDQGNEEVRAAFQSAIAEGRKEHQAKQAAQASPPDVDLAVQGWRHSVEVGLVVPLPRSAARRSSQTLRPGQDKDIVSRCSLHPRTL